jgi:cytochrome c oxidase subunit I
VHHPDVAKAEYAATGAPRDNLLDAGDDEGRVENLEENIEQQQQAKAPGSDDDPGE